MARAMQKLYHFWRDGKDGATNLRSASRMASTENENVTIGDRSRGAREYECGSGQKKTAPASL